MTIGSLAPSVGIIVPQRAAQPARLHPHDRVDLRIEIIVAAERGGGDGIGLDAVAAAGQRLFHHETQKAGELGRLAEGALASNLLQRGADFAGDRD